LVFLDRERRRTTGKVGNFTIGVGASIIAPIPTFLTREEIANRMPLYMDTHRKLKGVTAAAVAEAHAKDLKVQGKHGVNYRSYWVDEKTETVFCLVEAPNPEAAARVHKEAHGLVADEIHEVHQG